VPSIEIGEGGCLCGAVRYRLTGTPLSSVICHCASCRRASGAPSVAWITVDRRQCEILRGELTTYESSAGVVRGFCGRCGTPLTYETAARPASIDFTTLSLDAVDRFPPTEEVWLMHRVAWQPLAPGLRQGQGSTAD
jgi:hypothetical protein